jgi:hypothetical protein
VLEIYARSANIPVKTELPTAVVQLLPFPAEEKQQEQIFRVLIGLVKGH